MAGCQDKPEQEDGRYLCMSMLAGVPCVWYVVGYFGGLQIKSRYQEPAQAFEAA